MFFMVEFPAVLCPGEDWGPLRGFANWLKATRGQCGECQTAQIIFLETSSSLLCFKNAWPTLSVMCVLRKQNRTLIYFPGSSDGIFVPFTHVLLLSCGWAPRGVIFLQSTKSSKRKCEKKMSSHRKMQFGIHHRSGLQSFLKAKDHFSGLKIQEIFFLYKQAFSSTS